MGWDAEHHWQQLYASREDAELPWFQQVPSCSLDLIRAAGLPHNAPVIDVGGGSSTLVDHLLAEGYRDLTVLDVAPSALDRAKRRLGFAAEQVAWIAADITRWRPTRHYALWHDRAAFHFLRDAEDQVAYRQALTGAVSPGGFVIIACFAPEGPVTCAGLDVSRQSVEGLSAFLGQEFRLLESRGEDHITFAGNVQRFVFGLWRRESGSAR